MSWFEEFIDPSAYIEDDSAGIAETAGLTDGPETDPSSTENIDEHIHHYGFEEQVAAQPFETVSLGDLELRQGTQQEVQQEASEPVELAEPAQPIVQPPVQPPTQPAIQPAEEVEPVCPHCGVIYSTKKSVSEHVKLNHIGTRCFWPGCAANFTTERQLKDHTRNAHKPTKLGASRYRCTWPGTGPNPQPCRTVFAFESSGQRCSLNHQYWCKKEQEEAARQSLLCKAPLSTFSTYIA
ncbi:hypothetical protein Daesc_005509 [Daldinia eschscholtzii]|uniref:C2H2-type domain-containing protein n=1 Tax=Daldinia eschscholtzii TaxID=292717 RepID=A0AAX6MKQ8_9PEZI